MKSNYKTTTAFVFSILMLTGIFFLTSTSVSAQKKEDDKSDAKLARQAKITMDEAREAALKRVPGTVKEGELEKEKGKLIYSFDISTSDGMITEVWVDAKTGNVINVEKENAANEAAEKKADSKKDDDDEESDASQKANQAKYAKQAKITMDEAKAIALKEKNGTITDQELEKKKGRILYSFDVRTTDGKVFDVEVDAQNGKVLKVEEDKEDEKDDDN
ncbi:MAG TPA: PepSY domain-containing protein [Pyrinomonadaceae bacterium]|jgi:uncharacterized membrane protein YkoI